MTSLGVAAAATGRADLLRAFAAGGEEALAAMARALGYVEREKAPELEGVRAAPSVPAEPKLGAESENPPTPVPFWRVERVAHLTPLPAPPTRTIRPLGLDGVGRMDGARPAAPPLVSDARLGAALRPRLASTVPSRRVDVPLLAERWSRGEIARRIPFRPLAAWAPRITVLVDRSAHLTPFWQDQDRLLHQLRRRLGRGAVREVRFLDGYDRPWRDGRRRERTPHLEPGSPILGLGDFGFLAEGEPVVQWFELALRARRGGFALSALVPCPGERWQGDVARLWNAIPWERPGRAVEGGRRLAEEARLDRAERLLALLSFRSRFEPGFLRAVRRLLPAQEADAGTEADAWNHPEVAGGFSPAASPRPELRERLQARFAKEEPGLKQSVVATMRAWRAGEPMEIWLDEVLALDAAADLPPGTLEVAEIDAAEDLWSRLGETLDRPEGAVVRALAGFVGRAVTERVPRAAWKNERWKKLLGRAWEKAWTGEGAPPLPEGVGPEVFGSVEEVGPIRWQVRQVGSGLSFVPMPITPGGPVNSATGSLVYEVESGNGLVAGAPRKRSVLSVFPSLLARGIDLPSTASLVLRTDRTVATLRRAPPPEWANAMGRDRFGLWASFAVGEVEQRMRWIPPGRFWMGSPEDEPGRYRDEGPRHLETIEEGFWLADTPCTQELWQAVMGKNPSNFQEQKKPVEQVSWDDCKEFLEKLGKREGDAGEGWRLPHEKEWEYACRAGTETATYVGPMEIQGEGIAPVLDRIAWYGKNSGGATQSVAQKDPNPWGLYDMLGNVHEWCEDLWSANYSAEREGSSRVIRGGSWDSDARDVRAAYRRRRGPSSRWSILGFRFARGQSALQPGAEPRGAERPARGRARRGTRPPAPGPRTEGE